MKIIDLVQGTPEWHEFRKDGIGSSEIHQLLHSAPYGRTWNSLKGKKLLDKQEDIQTKAMKEGKEGEQLCIESLRKVNPNLKPVCGIHDEFPYMRCSMDAFDGHEIHEIKSPQAKKLEAVLTHGPEDDYKDQLRWQMLIADKDRGFLEIWDTASSHQFVVLRNEKWDKKALETAKKFWEFVTNGEAPLDYEVCDDEERALHLRKYRAIIAQIKDLEKEAEHEKERIIEKMERDFLLDGAKVFQSTVTSYDYKKMIEDYKIAKEAYEKKSKPFWKIAL